MNHLRTSWLIDLMCSTSGVNRKKRLRKNPSKTKPIRIWSQIRTETQTICPDHTFHSRIARKVVPDAALQKFVRLRVRYLSAAYRGSTERFSRPHNSPSSTDKITLAGHGVVQCFLVKTTLTKHHGSYASSSPHIFTVKFIPNLFRATGLAIDCKIPWKTSEQIFFFEVEVGGLVAADLRDHKICYRVRKASNSLIWPTDVVHASRLLWLQANDKESRKHHWFKVQRNNQNTKSSIQKTSKAAKVQIFAISP